jgi:phytoene synthase
MGPESLRDLRESLPPAPRLALAYAPAAARGEWLALLAFDARLAGIVLRSREPMLAQLRFAWWREQLASEVPPLGGEPLLELLAGWRDHRSALTGLVDGWEASLDADADRQQSTAGLAAARGSALAALATRIGCGEACSEADRAAREWTMAEYGGLSTQFAGLVPVRLPRPLRPLAILHGLAARSTRSGRSDLLERPTDLVVAVRIGLLGR